MASVIEKTIRKAVTPAIQAVASLNRTRLQSEDANPFLHGVHEPLREEHTLTELAVTGAIPAELDGRYVRIGPNPHGSAGRGTTGSWATGWSTASVCVTAGPNGIATGSFVRATWKPRADLRRWVVHGGVSGTR